MKIPARVGIFGVVTALLMVSPVGAASLPVERVSLPPGFKIEVYAADVPGARSLALGPRGVLFVGSRREGRVYAVVDNDQDGRADDIKTIASRLRYPNGVAFRNGDLYVAEIQRILKFEDIMEDLTRPPQPVVVNAQFPTDVWHGWKYIAFGPDGLLYVPVGMNCNVCKRDDPVYGTIMRMNPDGTGLEIFARGIRNTVGFDWHPETGELWFTDNGRDYMGDNKPPDELNHAPRPGMHFGFPYCHGTAVQDPEYNERSCQEFTPPVQDLGPHVAALGITFYDGQQFPPPYQKQVFIAEHGSWNRSTKIGYRVTLVTLENGVSTGYKTFAEGWLDDGRVWGRPVDVLVDWDGALLVSDDYAGAVYRIIYQGRPGD